MDIENARDFLNGKNIELQKQIDANKLALSLLENTFTAEFSRRDQALNELEAATAVVEEKDRVIAEKEAVIEEKEAEIAQKESELAELTKEAAPVEEVIP